MQTSIPRKSEMSTRRLFFQSTHWDSRKSTKTRFRSKDKRVTELELSKGVMNILAISLSPRSTKASTVHLHALSRCPHLGRLSHCSDQKCVLKMSKLVLILPIVLFNFRLCCVNIEDHI